MIDMKNPSSEHYREALARIEVERRNSTLKLIMRCSVLALAASTVALAVSNAMGTSFNPLIALLFIFSGVFWVLYSSRGEISVTYQTHYRRIGGETYESKAPFGLGRVTVVPNFYPMVTAVQRHANGRVELLEDDPHGMD